MTPSPFLAVLPTLDRQMSKSSNCILAISVALYQPSWEGPSHFFHYKLLQHRFERAWHSDFHSRNASFFFYPHLIMFSRCFWFLGIKCSFNFFIARYFFKCAGSWVPMQKQWHCEHFNGAFLNRQTVLSQQTYGVGDHCFCSVIGGTEVTNSDWNLGVMEQSCMCSDLWEGHCPGRRWIFSEEAGCWALIVQCSQPLASIGFLLPQSPPMPKPADNQIHRFGPLPDLQRWLEAPSSCVQRCSGALSPKCFWQPNPTQC